MTVYDLGCASSVVCAERFRTVAKSVTAGAHTPADRCCNPVASVAARTAPERVICVRPQAWPHPSPAPDSAESSVLRTHMTMPDSEYVCRVYDLLAESGGRTARPRRPSRKILAQPVAEYERLSALGVAALRCAQIRQFGRSGSAGDWCGQPNLAPPASSMTSSPAPGSTSDHSVILTMIL
jgi:hypothetical protein